MNKLKICSYTWAGIIRFYVAQLPGDGGKDWGYTENRDHALKLSPYWQRRFNADCRRIGQVARIETP